MRRASARLQLNRPAAALEDAMAVLSIDPSHAEAFSFGVRLTCIVLQSLQPN